VNPHFRQKHSATVILRARKHQKTPGKRQENIRKHQKTSGKHPKKTSGDFSFSRLRKVFEKEDKALPSGATHFPDPDGLRSAHGRAAGRARVKRNAMLMHIYIYCIYVYIYYVYVYYILYIFDYNVYYIYMPLYIILYIIIKYNILYYT
jgi:hypothetical protein